MTHKVLPSVQPTHCTSDMRYAVDRIGEERAQFAYIWQTFLDQGVQVPMGSDFPVASSFARRSSKPRPATLIA